MKIFVSGTNTDVGKTNFCALLANFYKKINTVSYIKIVQTGYPFDNDSQKIAQSGIEAKTLLFGEPPVAPYFIFDKFPINYVMQEIEKSNSDITIIEGSGGLLVPLDKQLTFADIVKIMGLETIIVVPNKLGCINDTLLNLYYCQKEKIKLKGFALNNFFLHSLDNFDALQNLTNNRIVYKFKKELEAL